MHGCTNKGMSTFDYIMSKRERKKHLQTKIQSIDERIRQEEEKIAQIREISNRSPVFASMHKKEHEQRTKSSTGERFVNEEDSKGSLLERKSGKHVIMHDKDDSIEPQEEEEHKDHADNEMGFRITASSMFKHNFNNASEDNKNDNEDTGSQNESLMNTYTPADIHNHKHGKLRRAKSSNLHVIEDVSESKELSQKAFESFKIKASCEPSSALSRRQRISKKDLRDTSYSYPGRNEHNNSELIKS